MGGKNDPQRKRIMALEKELRRKLSRTETLQELLWKKGYRQNMLRTMKIILTRLPKGWVSSLSISPNS